MTVSIANYHPSTATRPVRARLRPCPLNDRQQMLQLMLQLYYKLMAMPETYDGYPKWGDSTDQLMEMAWELWHTHTIVDPVTQRKATLKQIATNLCTKLHRKVPRNISGVVRQSKGTGRMPVIDYFVKLAKEARVGPAFFVISEPLPTLPPMRPRRNSQGLKERWCDTAGNTQQYKEAQR
jgi:hypothetical protein